MEYRQERRIEKHLSSSIKKIGGHAMKITSPGMAGVPDRLVLINGMAVFVELKAPGRKPTERQLAIHRYLVRLGFPVHVIDSMHGVDCLVRELSNNSSCNID